MKVDLFSELFWNRNTVCQRKQTKVDITETHKEFVRVHKSVQVSVRVQWAYCVTVPVMQYCYYSRRPSIPFTLPLPLPPSPHPSLSLTLTFSHAHKHKHKHKHKRKRKRKCKRKRKYKHKHKYKHKYKHKHKHKHTPAKATVQVGRPHPL